jgi:hypothetical protein
MALALTGCASANIVPKPPKHPEEITVPPLADAKFSSPPKYPEGTLNQEDNTKSPRGPGGPGGPGGMPNMNAMNSMGNMGGRGAMYGGGPGTGYNGR